jgi:PIN domain nuclease of toxin-antitoxin system
VSSLTNIVLGQVTDLCDRERSTVIERMIHYLPPSILAPMMKQVVTEVESKQLDRILTIVSDPDIDAMQAEEQSIDCECELDSDCDHAVNQSTNITDNIQGALELCQS